MIPDFSKLMHVIQWLNLFLSVDYLLSQAYRLGEAAAVAPFEYSSMPLALVLGFYLWGDWPDLIAFAGSSLIILGGLLVIFFEHQSVSQPPR